MISLVTPVKGTPVRTNFSVTTSVKIASVNLNRKSLMIQNQGSATVFIGGSDVAISGASRGYALFAGATFTDNATAGEWWCISSTGTNVVHVEEVS